MSSSTSETPRAAIAAPGGADDPSKVVVRLPQKSRVRLSHVPGYWPLVSALARRDLKMRYKQSLLGPAWVVFQPLALLAAFSVGFRSVANVHTAGVPYALFALTGLVVWSYFQAVTMVAAGAIVNNFVLVRWTACPRLALPLATLVSNLPSLAVPLLAALIAAAASGYLSLKALLIPALALWMFVLIGALALFLSTLTVRARDMLSVLPFLLQVVMFLCPIAYDTAKLSSTLRTLISINPLTGLVEAWRWALLGVAPGSAALAISLALTAGGALVSWRVFTRSEVRIADVI